MLKLIRVPFYYKSKKDGKERKGYNFFLLTEGGTRIAIEPVYREVEDSQKKKFKIDTYRDLLLLSSEVEK